MLAHVEPPGYQRKAKREQPVLGAHVSWIPTVEDWLGRIQPESWILGKGREQVGE
jgi:hypothetical protein